MLCPITFRNNGLGIRSYQIPIKELRKEQNWKICRHMIVFAGSLLAMIYGLMILISINSFANQSPPTQELLLFREILINGNSTGFGLIIIASFGCASIFFKRYLSLL